jgi:serine/threonine-protein kinase
MQSIGKYEVVEKIGEGGFGAVYKGFDPHIRRFVAIKSCTSEAQEVRNRFFHEAQISGNLQHRNIVTVYDFGLQEGVPYLVQEYLSGEDLDRKVKRRDVLPLAEKLLYLIQVARGLDYAHSKGVVHRDIKPANIRILEDGTAKIMDFGIAKLADQETGLTQTGMTLGTAAYLAPEQIRGEPIGSSTDIFSWGVTAWELLVYQRPFTGQHISTVLYQILHEAAPPLREHATDCPPEVAAIVERCLEKKPERRYASCAELLRDFDQALKSRKLGPDTEVGALLRRASAEVAETRSMPSPPPRPIDLGARTAPVAVTPLPHDELVDFELDSPGQSRRTPRSISTTRVGASQTPAWVRWTAAGAAALVLSVLAIVLFRQPEPAAVGAGSAERLAAGSGDLPSRGVAGAVAVPTPEPPPAATPEPTPEATPTPRPGRLVVPAAWSPDVHVTVAGQRRSLSQARSFTVSPGAPIAVRFDYSGDYADEARRTVTVGEGLTVELEIPLQRPGQLQVQQRLATPMGRIWIDGNEAGQGRAQRNVRPGAHRIRVEPTVAGAQSVEQMVEVPSGKRVVATFDLNAGQLVQVVRDLE